MLPDHWWLKTTPQSSCSTDLQSLGLYCPTGEMVLILWGKITGSFCSHLCLPSRRTQPKLMALCLQNLKIFISTLTGIQSSLLPISLLHPLHFPFVNSWHREGFDFTSDASSCTLSNLTSPWSNDMNCLRQLLQWLWAKCVVLELIWQFMNLKLRSYSEISFVYAIFLEIKLNYSHPAEKQKCFIDSVIDLTLRLNLKNWH